MGSDLSSTVETRITMKAVFLTLQALKAFVRYAQTVRRDVTSAHHDP